MCPPTTFGSFAAAQFFYPTEMMFSMPPPYPTMPVPVTIEQYGYGYYPEPQPCGSFDEDNKENAVSSNYKTRLCKLHNSGKSTFCPHGANCRFAHGVEELRSNGSIPDQQVQSKSYKIILCRNYAPGGSGDCPYRLACQYIHPSDGLLFKFCQADTPEFKVLKGQHQEEIQKLHAQRMMAPPSQQFQLEATINWKVRQFNIGHPNGSDYHDMHGMTTMGMVSYVQDIVQQMRRTGSTKSWLEVGRGNHSANGFPAQRMMVAPSQQFQLEASINWKVRQFNVGHPNGRDYHDLHGMTTMGMISYVQDIVKQMRKTGSKKSWLEVGRGTHSANGFPAMKAHLMNNLHLFPGCSFVPIIGNDDSIIMCPPTSFGIAAQYFFQADMMFSMPPPHYAPMPVPVPMEQYGYGYYPEPQPCDSFYEDNKENVVSTNYKTRLCKLHNSGKSTFCPHGASCRFAHGLEELRSNGSIPDQQVASKSYKTILCRNYAPGGSGDCPYRLACQYIHPSDGLLYKFCQADTPEFKVLKGQHQEEIQKLHVQRMMAPPSQQFQLEASINWKVRQFNIGHPNGSDYHDMHGMTTMGMVSYVQDIIQQLRRTGGTKAWLEVGRGTHSANGFPAMKTHLMNNCHLFPGCSFVPIIGNDGILELTVD
ncbi:hypothetical protein B9Z55_007578 [Caenorhabditis nigoni]|uniref:C3H1-type domain-containing protein n=1 Tax=Caenorhabditis nigoni TaxID=1611254 RepID=A0A2G5VA88_9PELO|nr:hypothetical protein B9Z55_007578 [Caenorhabditis nigoni]